LPIIELAIHAARSLKDPTRGRVCLEIDEIRNEPAKLKMPSGASRSGLPKPVPNQRPRDDSVRGFWHAAPPWPAATTRRTTPRHSAAARRSAARASPLASRISRAAARRAHGRWLRPDLPRRRIRVNPPPRAPAEVPRPLARRRHACGLAAGSPWPRPPPPDRADRRSSNARSPSGRCRRTSTPTPPGDGCSCISSGRWPSSNGS
jgi:hypothetical protein